MSDETVLHEQGDGATQEVADWKAGLPDDLKADPSLESIKDIPGLVKSYVNAQKLIGRDKIPMPKDESDPLWEDVYKRLGRPDTPDSYEFVKPEGLPDYDEASEKAFKEQAHKLGLSAKQAKGLFEWYGATSLEKFNAMNETQKATLEQAASALKSEWGQAYSDNISTAQKAVEFYGLKNLASNPLVGNDPDFVKCMVKLGSGLKEDGLRGTQGANLTPADAQSKINAILQDPTHPYHDRYKPGHKEAIEEVFRLHEAAAPTEV